MKHAFVPDTQVHPGSKIEHIKAAGLYIGDKRPERIILIGDWWDMNSLSSYDKPGQHGWEDKDVMLDLECGKEAMSLFHNSILATAGPAYEPRIDFFEGNHEDRVYRAATDPVHRKFAKYLTRNAFEYSAYTYPMRINKFLHPRVLEGVAYCHYFVNPDSLTTNPIGGTIENKLRKLGHSFSMGHQQHKQTGSVYTATGERRVGLVCGRFYPDYHEYLGPQKNRQSWSGIFIKHEVHKGDYDLMEVSMKYLLKEWT